ncbi:MAG: NAD(P)-dependent glycerol-3-phosphate dehydrogenase [Chloroflexi bacterium]|nr:NAD(P)-dependent glycerol-3-phosphate dehydrogenase [Chloroflexota bacterium]
MVVAVVNAGGWGTALAVLLAHNGHEVRLWARRAEQAANIAQARENQAYLPGVALPPSVTVSSDLRDALSGADAVLFAPISRAVRETARAAAASIQPGQWVAHVAKGLEVPGLLRLSEVVEQELGTAFRGRVAAISGPTHAEEVGRGLPTAAVVACEDSRVAAGFQAMLHGPTFRVYTSPDVVGVELCGAMKNVIAIAVGASDGLGYGDNARAALITRALAEIGRLAAAVGADARTVSGLAGLGDVVATCTSGHSRNRWAGEQIGRGRSVEAVLASTPKVVEGIPAARAAVELEARWGVELPICRQVFRVVHEGAPVRDAIASLMGREPTAET